MQAGNMGSPERKPGPAPQNAESGWRDLYWIAGLAALLTALFIPIQIVVFVVWPPPSTVTGWFTLFHNNRLLGLLDMDLLILVEVVLLIPILLALYVVLRRVTPSFTALATTLGLVGIVAYFASNPAFSMVTLSDQYAAATTDAQRSALLAAGQAMLATYSGTAFDAYYLLASVALVMISTVMLRTNVFSKATAYIGILANALALGLFVPTVGLLLSLVSVIPFLLIWYILLARRLFQLSKLRT
jgi:hypothetical protein